MNLKKPSCKFECVAVQSRYLMKWRASGSITSQPKIAKSRDFRKSCVAFNIIPMHR